MKKTNTTGLFVGRFQPFHLGHLACIKKILETHEECVVGVRDTDEDENNPLSLMERVNMIETECKDLNVIVMPIPDIDTVFIGRDVGYELIRLTPELEGISATNIRKELYADNNR